MDDNEYGAQIAADVAQIRKFVGWILTLVLLGVIGGGMMLIASAADSGSM